MRRRDEKAETKRQFENMVSRAERAEGQVDTLGAALKASIQELQEAKGKAKWADNLKQKVHETTELQTKLFEAVQREKKQVRETQKQIKAFGTAFHAASVSIDALSVALRALLKVHPDLRDLPPIGDDS